MARTKSLSLLAGGLLLALACQNACAWGSKEHIMLTNLAAQKVIADPAAAPDMKAWLKRVCPDLGTPESTKQFFLTAKVGVTRKDAKGMSLYAIEPDNRAGDKKTLIEPFGIPERPLHFTDLELLNRDVDKQVYKHDLSSMPKLADVPRDMKDPRWKQAGMLPFAVEHSYKKLVQAIKAGRLGNVDDKPEADSAVVWAGRLAHYLEDNTQPMHASEDYTAKSYFGDKRGAPNVHSEMEYKMNDDAKQPFPKLRADYWDAFTKELRTIKDPVQTEDLWLGTMQVSMESYKSMPLIGLAAMNASGQQGTPDRPRGKSGDVDTERFFRFSANVNGKQESVMQMKARQQAWAVARVARIWQQAWAEAKGN